MSSTRFRAMRRFVRGGKKTSRIVERLEPRCVLSAAALYAPPIMSPGRHVDFVDGAAIEHSALRRSNLPIPARKHFSPAGWSK